MLEEMEETVQTIPLRETGEISHLHAQRTNGNNAEVIAVTEDGEPVLAVVPWGQYMSLLETLEILSDPEMVAAIRDGEAAIAADRGVPLEQALADLGWA